MGRVLGDLRDPVGGAVIALPWPTRKLWPNTRVAHPAQKAGAVKEARTAAWAIMLEKGVRWPETAHLRLTFHAPTTLRYDLDNALAACKPAIDGMADASKCDDSRWSYTLVKGEPVGGGRVVVELV